MDRWHSNYGRGSQYRPPKAIVLIFETAKWNPISLKPPDQEGSVGL